MRQVYPDFPKLANAISSDAHIFDKLLTWANSAGSGATVHITKSLQALIRFGLKTCARVLRMALEQVVLFKTELAHFFSNRNLYLAVACRSMNEGIPPEGIPLEHCPALYATSKQYQLYAYSMGMFEDIGALVLANESTPDYDGSLTSAERQCVS